MALTPVQMFAPTTLTTTAATLYTTPDFPTQQVLVHGVLRFVNTDVAQRTVTAYAVPSGGSATVTNTFCPALVVQPGNILDVAVPVLAAGSFIQAKVDSGTAVKVDALDGVLWS